MIVSIISIILLVIFSIILLSFYKRQVIKLRKKTDDKIKEKYEEYIENKILEEKRIINIAADEYREAVLQQQQDWLDSLRQERSNVERSLNERKQAVEEIIEQIESRRNEAEKNYQAIINNEKEKIDIELENYRTATLGSINQTILEESIARKAAAEKLYQEEIINLNNQKAEKLTELGLLIEEINDFKKKQSVINEEILRRREVEEKEEFFKINLDENSIRDIQILLSIREKLISRENLDKLIYDVYISKPVMEMIKRVLAGGAPSGIYKITRLKTGEIYIGKSTDVKKRWTEHCKTAFGVGSIAHSILHTTMKKDGIENFTFELLEEVPKDKLTEREKYWITFYDSKNYGLNERNG